MLGYNCPPPTVTLDPFDAFQNRYIDVGAGGPAPFTFTVTSNATWVKLSPTRGSISTSNPEQRVFASVPDWSKLAAGANFATLTFTATAKNQLVNVLTVPVVFAANNTKSALPSNFKGKLLKPA